MSVRNLALEKGILTKEQVEQIFDLEYLIGRRKLDKK
jgi:aspartate ammonia-lyase